MPKETKKASRIEKAYGTLHAAVDALCHTAAALVDKQCDLQELRARVFQWQEAAAAVAKLAFTKAAVERALEDKAERIGHETWLTPYWDAWIAQYQGTPNGNILANAMKPLEEKNGAEEVLRRWKIYLAETPGRFASPKKFAATWADWITSSDPTAVRPGETSDQYLARMTTNG